MSDSDFLIISPLPVTWGRMSFSNIPLELPPAQDSAVVYAAGDIASVGSYVFISLQDNNVGHDLDAGLAGVSFDPWSRNSEWWRYICIAYPKYSAVVTYSIDEIVTYYVTIPPPPPDISRDLYPVPALYRSLVSANLGNPVSDPDKWLRVGAENSWKMFDTTYGSQTERADEIVVTLTPGQSFTSLYLDNMDATSVTVTQTVSGYSRTISLTNTDLDWYTWFFRDYAQQRNCLFDDIPSLSQSALTITISNPGAIAKCGLCVIGTRTKLGRTLWGVNGGILSFSGTTTDAFGNTTFLKRANARRLNFDVFIDSGYESEVFKVLDDHTDMPLVIIGSSLHEMCMAYGFLGEWNVPLTPGGSVAQIEIKSLV